MSQNQNSSHEANTKPTRANQAWVEGAVRQIQSGNEIEEHFRHIFEVYEPLCRRLLMCLAPAREVDDLVQDVMFRVYRGIETFRLDSSFETWLRRIVKNAAKNAHRNRETGKAKATEASLEAMLEAEGDAKPALAEPASLGGGPLESTLDSERLEHLEAALESLPERMRRCVELRLFHGFRYREIAQLQGVSIATVKKQISEGRKRLRPALSAFAKLFGLFLALLVLVV